MPKNYEKKLLQLVLTITLLFSVNTAKATVYGNEWIEYNLTYYKFKISNDGVYRIPIASLSAVGVPLTTLGSNFKMYKDGQEQPIYVSNENLSISDYIEFIGKKEEGNLDKELYGLNPQANSRMSLYSDTACYYLTFDNNTNHLRYNLVSNILPTNTPSPLNYCLATVGLNYKSNFLQGQSNAPNDLFISSQYETGEGFIHNLNDQYTPESIYLSAPNALSINGVNAHARSSVLATSLANSHEFQFYLNNQLIADSTSNNTSVTQSFDIPVASANIVSNNEFKITPINGQTGYDKYGISFVELTYPRNFDVAGLNYFKFKLPPSISNQYLEFTNWNYANSKLYDITNNQWYVGDHSIAGKQRYNLLPTAVEHQYVLITDGQQIPDLSISKTINFIDYSKSTNQGNYLIITHNNLMAVSNGHNYIQDYKNYRSSIDGGAYKVQIADVNDLYDQFAYGVVNHPLSIRHYLNFAYDNWKATPAQHVCLIGRGVLYNEYSDYLNNPTLYNFPIVPTYGNPGSDLDLVNFGNDILKQKLNIGRISVWNASEIGTYLDKVIAYEKAEIPDPNPSLQSELWKKTALHIVGSSDNTIIPYISAALDQAQSIIENPFTGKLVAKNVKIGNKYNYSSTQIDSFFNSGVSLVTYFGHATPIAFDFSSSNPEQITARHRHPFFIALGCDVAQMFHLQLDQKTLSERYLLAKDGGAIALVASVNSGYLGLLDPYLNDIYTSMAIDKYSQTYGEQFAYANDQFYNQYLNNGTVTPYVFTHNESFLYIGDPAIKSNTPALPDYHITKSAISTIPTHVNTELDSFQLKINAFNLGKSLDQTVAVQIVQINPTGKIKTVGNYSTKGLNNVNSTSVSLGINKLMDGGLNKFIITIDPNNLLAESSEINNTDTFIVNITNDDVIPSFPYNFSIVYNQGVTLKASTLLTPFVRDGRYIIEIDTTELFNSPSKLATSIASYNGVLSWTPSLTLVDSTVYYWRASTDPTYYGTYNWKNSSFIYLAHGAEGWNQSHFYQYTKDSFSNLEITEKNRTFNFPFISNTLKAYNTVAYNGSDAAFGKIFLNDVYVQAFSQVFYNSSLQIMVLDSLTALPWINSANNTCGALAPYNNVRGTYVREFYPLTDATVRNAAAHFLDSIPNGNYILVKNMIYNDLFVPSYIDDWKADTVINGSGKSLYHSLYNLGFNTIDQYTSKRAFLFMRKKGSTSYPVYQKINSGLSGDYIVNTFDINGLGTAGNLTSTVIGPVNKWNKLLWNTKTNDGYPSNDSSTVTVIGINTNNEKIPLFTTQNNDTDLSGIDAKVYPQLQLQWFANDSLSRTSPQLAFWRVLFSPVVDLALSPNKKFSFSKAMAANVYFGNFTSAITNLTNIPLSDSILVRYSLIDTNGLNYPLADINYRPLGAFDTVQIGIHFDPTNIPQASALFVQVNPNQTPVEQYYPNNNGYFTYNTTAVPLAFDKLDISAVNKGFRNFIVFNTLEENNVVNYFLEKSSDGANFSKLDDVTPIQNQLNYNYSDFKPFRGTTYYRVTKQYANGKELISKTVSADFDSTLKFGINMFPNPFNEQIKIIIFGTVTDQSSIQLTTLDGKILLKNTIINNETTLNTSALPANNYILKYFDGEHTEVIKIVKLNEK